MMTEALHVITGGPGAGKTSVAAALARVGIATMPEAGRAIIRAQSRIGADALPWANRMAFAAAMLVWDMRSHEEALALEQPVVLDRGLPDVIGYLTVCGLAVPEAMWNAARRLRYNRRVFMAPYWPDIFRGDSERRQTAAEAQKTARVMGEIYAALDYELVPLPLASIAARAAFIRAEIGC